MPGELSLHFLIRFATLWSVTAAWSVTAQDTPYYRVTIDATREKAQVEARIPIPGGHLRMDGGLVDNALPNGLATLVEGLIVTDDSGRQLVVTGPEGTTWTIADAPESPVTVRYTVRLDHNDYSWNFGADEVAYKRDDCFFFVSRSLLVQPGRVDGVEVSFEVPSDWRISTSWPRIPGRPNTFLAHGNRDLLETCVLLGTHSERVVTEGDTRVTLAFGHDVDPYADAFDDGIQTGLRAFSELFGDAPPAAFLITMNPVQRGMWGAGAFDSSISVLTPQRITGSDQQMVLHTIAHEIFHLWNGRKLKAKGQAEWFTEGVTDYMTWKVLRREGLIDREMRLKQLERDLAAYCNQVGQESIARAGAQKAKFYSLVYSGGSCVALAMDVFAQQATQGEKSFDDILRALYAAARDTGFTSEQVAKVAQEVSGYDFAPFFEKYVSGKETMSLAEIAALAGLELTITPKGDHTSVNAVLMSNPSPEQAKIRATLLGE
ncbi:MAG: M1 family aminopeptidase [Candidatus Hydrogenedentota bacterium]